MNVNKNLIEILDIEGNEVAVSRQGINNCMVNLTQMAKPYGKLVADWLRLKSTREYLTHRGKAAIEEKLLLDRYGNPHNENQERSSNSHIAFDETYGGQIIMVQGGNAKEQGTWCTDFHIALDFALWLDPVRKDIVYDHFIKYLTGRNVGTLVNTNRLLPRDRKDIDPSFWTELRKYVLPKDIRDVAARMNVTLRHAQKVLAGTVTSYPVMEQFVAVGTSNRANGIMRPEPKHYEQLAFQFVEPKAKED